MDTIVSSPHQIKDKIDRQTTFFKTGATLEVAFRLKHLKSLLHEIEARHDEITKALYDDLKKSEYEAYITEIAIVKQELKKTIKNLPKWSRPRKVKTPLAFKPASSQIRPEPFGKTLIIAPWNFPFSLIMLPLIGAVAAGNTAVCKPSELAPNTAKVFRQIIKSIFQEDYVAVIEGGVAETTAILRERFDYIFFTGSPHVGKIIYKAAAEHLTPVTLELGGKSPCIVDKTANLDVAASRIVVAKYLNCGQICIAPDYLLAHESIKDELVDKMKGKIIEFYTSDPKKSEDYGRMINVRNFDRVASLIDQSKVVHGGDIDREQKFISPTIMDNVGQEDAVMKDEIFGPILPVISFTNLDQVKEMINGGEKPLALYMYSKSKDNINDVLKNCSSGGVNINDCLLQNVNKYLPFGGVGRSGIGAYNGQLTFDTFSHMKAEVHKAAGFDMPTRYPPLRKRFKVLKWVADNI